MTAPLRVGNCSGFYGDRFDAMAEMLEGGKLDVLTGDYLAELTMLILGRDRQRDPTLGYARTFLRQLEQCLVTAVANNVRIVVNAGGLNPAGLAGKVRELAATLGVNVRVAHVEGDDVRTRAAEFGFGDALTANAYLGAWGIAEALSSDVHIVVTGRVTDASLVVGPAAAHFGWARDDYDALAGATVAGHVLECGAQATGGNYAFFDEIPDLAHPGFPLAEIYDDGSSVITKHPGTGGQVSVGTVTAQLLYEIDGPRYLGPDVTTRFDTIVLGADGPDRVRINDVRGEPPPPALKVGLTQLGGYRNEVVFVLTGLQIEAKAALVQSQLGSALRGKPAELTFTLVRTDHDDADTEEAASGYLHAVVRDADPKVIGRAFSGAAVELALASYPGFHLLAPPGDAEPYGVFTATSIAADQVTHRVVYDDGTARIIGPPPNTQQVAPVPEPPLPDPAPATGFVDGLLGEHVGARSGDKGGMANLGVWVATDAAWPWLVQTLTVEQLRRLLPETSGLAITRHVLPNLRAVNFVIEGLLGEGVASHARFDPQAKALGEWLRVPARERSETTAVTVLRSGLDVTSEEYRTNRVALLDQVTALDEEHAKAIAGGGPKYLERHRGRGKLLARERIEALLDDDAPFLELSTLAAWGTEFPVGGSVVTGIGRVSGVEAVVLASDPTVRGGAVNPYGLKKTLRALEIAERNQLPVINLVESGGADLATQSQIFIPGGAPFRALSRLSAQRIPTVAIVFGNSTAGGAYLPGMSDHIVMIKERSAVFLAGPPLVKVATGEDADEEALGGAEMHATTSGLADYFAVDELDALRIGRRIMARLNWRKTGAAPATSAPPRYDVDELAGIVPTDLRVPFDPHDVIARIVDDSDFDEFKARYGTSLVTGWAQLHGFPIGLLANARGVLFSEESQKATQFIQLANQSDTPLLFLHNTTGYMVGTEYEQGGIIRHGAQMINAVSNSGVPHLSVIMGASYGAGAYGMSGRAYDPRFLFSWPTARSAVMGPAQLAGVMRLVGGGDEAVQAALEAKIERESLPMFLSGMLYDDGVIDPRDTRTVLGICLSAIHTAPVHGTAGYGVFR